MSDRCEPLSQELAPCFSHLVFTEHPLVRYHYHSHSSREGAEAQEWQETCQGHTDAAQLGLAPLSQRLQGPAFPSRNAGACGLQPSWCSYVVSCQQACPVADYIQAATGA